MLYCSSLEKILPCQSPGARKIPVLEPSAQWHAADLDHTPDGLISQAVPQASASCSTGFLSRVINCSPSNGKQPLPQLNCKPSGKAAAVRSAHKLSSLDSDSEPEGSLRIQCSQGKRWREQCGEGWFVQDHQVIISGAWTKSESPGTGLFQLALVGQVTLSHALLVLWAQEPQSQRPETVLGGEQIHLK